MRATARTALSALLLGAAACHPRPQAPLLEHPSPVFRGHQDLYGSSVDAGTLVPWVLDRSGTVGLCLDAPPGADTSQWEARLFLEDAAPATPTYSPPTVRLDTSVCFETRVFEELKNGTSRLCAELRDRFDGTLQSLPCLAFRFDTDDRVLRGLEKSIPVALAGPVVRLEALSDQAREQRLPALALRLRLIAAYTLRREGSDASRARAAELLRDEPPWIDLPAAERWAGQLAYERATLKLETKTDLAGSWELLRAAERSFRTCGERKWIAVVAKQAEVLSRAGALTEAKERLRFALGQCASAPCDPALVRSAENTLAWLATSDPDADESELVSADRTFESLLAGENAPGDPLEHANLLLNLAFARERRGLAPGPLVRRARDLIGAGASSRGRELSGWADLVDGRQALRAGRAADAARVCDRVGESGESARLRAFGLSCAAAAYRRLGARDRTRNRLADALVLHAATGARRLAQDVPLGPGQRAEDVYAAARAELEGGRPEAAWSLLRDLDEETSAPFAPTEAGLEPWLETLQDLDRPSSPPRRAQREAIRRGALDRLQELIRSRHGPAGAGTADTDVTFRAFPLDDEIVVLRQTSAGAIVLYRRTPMPRSSLAAAVRAVDEAIAQGEPDDARWAALLEPLGRALAPLPEDLGPVTTFAMHGILQEVPLAALPLRSGTGPRFLGEVTTVAWHPAGAVAPDRPMHPPGGGAVFVLDPLGDLGLPDARGSALGETGTRVLWRDGATRDALRTALEKGRWLHIEAHARYEPAFPELSTILLADGPVTGQELSAWAAGLELANLSGCETGRSPISADSGRFGLSGLLARHGVAWVVGTRAALSNALALDFNRAFRASLATGAGVPEAYRRALDDVRGRHPASRWAILVLLHAEPGRMQGQSSAERTPLLMGDMR